MYMYILKLSTVFLQQRARRRWSMIFCPWEILTTDHYVVAGADVNFALNLVNDLKFSKYFARLYLYIFIYIYSVVYCVRIYYYDRIYRYTLARTLTNSLSYTHTCTQKYVYTFRWCIKKKKTSFASHALRFVHTSYAHRRRH